MERNLISIFSKLHRIVDTGKENEHDISTLYSICKMVPINLLSNFAQVDAIANNKIDLGNLSNEEVRDLMVNILEELDKVKTYAYHFENDQHMLKGHWITGEIEWLATFKSQEMAESMIPYFSNSTVDAWYKL